MGREELGRGERGVHDAQTLNVTHLVREVSLFLLAVTGILVVVGVLNEVRSKV